MTYSLNITFVMAPSEQNRFLSWMRAHALPLLFFEGSPARSPRLQQVVEVGGEAPAPDHGLSIALQSEFESVAAAHQWSDTVLAPVLGAFTREFGPHAAFFSTMLENLDL